MAYGVYATAALALLCILPTAFGHFNEPPTGFNATTSNARGEYVDIELSWNAGSCWEGLWSPSYTIKKINDAGEQEFVARVEGTSYTLEDAEYWTNYRFVLSMNFPCIDGGKAYTNQSTGPGNPHEVQDVTVQALDTSVSLGVTPARSAVPITFYNVTACSEMECDSHIINITVSMGEQMTIDRLQPEMHYNASITANIVFENETYTSFPRVIAFDTDKAHPPRPTDIHMDFFDNEPTVEAHVYWTIPAHDDYVVDSYNFTLDTADNGTVFSKVLHDPEVNITGLPYYADVNATIIPVFNVNGEIIHGKRAVFQSTTPPTHIKAPRNFQTALMTPSYVFVGWDAPEGIDTQHLQYNFTLCADNDCRNGTASKNIQAFVDLKANTTYRFAITALETKHHVYGDTLKKNFTTLEEERPAPEDLKVSVEKKFEDSVLYNLTWTIDEAAKVSFFTVTLCDGVKPCSVNKTESTSFELSLNYFSKYVVVVTANYTLPLGKSYPRNNGTLLHTIGTTPEAVNNLTVTNVEVHSIELSWLPPKNVPDLPATEIVYEISDHERKVNVTTNWVILNGLTAYTKYNFSVHAIVTFGEEYEGEKAFEAATTHVARPSEVLNVTAKQLPYSDLAQVNWIGPKEPNGPIDFYSIQIYENGKPIGKREKVNHNTTVQLPNKDGEKFTIGVEAVNRDKDNYLFSNETKSKALVFKGLEAPVDAEVIDATSNSLILDIIPSDDSNSDKLFYHIQDSNNHEWTSKSPENVTIGGLKPYTEQFLWIRVCATPKFCSTDAYLLNSTTNVGEPHAVRNLAVSVDNRTNLLIVWDPPTVANGPLSGYVVNITDKTDSRKNVISVDVIDQTYYWFKSSDEYETFSVTVAAFNDDIWNNDTRVFGSERSAQNKTSGWHAPKPDLGPVNVTTSSVSFSWEKPHDPNFNVTLYKYKLTTPDKTTHGETTETFVKIDKQKPYTKIELEVQSCTNETECGLARYYAEVTDMDAPSEPLSVEVKYNKTEAEVHWKQPKDLNGPLDGFDVHITEGKDKKVANMSVDAKTTMWHVKNLTESTEYTVHVVAFNLDHRRNKTLHSSEATHDFKTDGTAASGSVSPWLIAILVVLALAAVAGVGFVVYKKRMAQRSDDTHHLVQA